jgi:hypothetical protein
MLFASDDAGLIAATFALVAVTGVLAIATAAMAWKTREAVRETARAADAAEKDLALSNNLLQQARRQADAAVDALVAARQPELILGLGWDNTATEHFRVGAREVRAKSHSILLFKADSETWLAVRLWNVGPGTAHVGGIGGDVMAIAQNGNRVAGEAQTRVIASGQTGYVAFCDARVDESSALAYLMEPVSTGEVRTVTVTVMYFDLDRARAYVSHLRLRTTGAGRLELSGVEIERVAQPDVK